MSKGWEKLSVLTRLTKTVDVASKIILLHAYILSQFEYCPLVWHFCSRDKMKKTERIKKQVTFKDFNTMSCSLRKSTDHWCTPIDWDAHYHLQKNVLVGNIHVYLNELFAVKTGSNNRKLKMLMQPKYNSKYGCNCIRYQGPSLRNTYIISSSLLHSSMYGPWCVRVLATTCVPWKSCKIVCTSVFIVL